MFLSFGDLIMMVNGPGPFLLLAGLLFYFLPTVISWNRSHQQTGPIIILNVLLGWTFLGWVVALAWSASAVTTSRA